METDEGTTERANAQHWCGGAHISAHSHSQRTQPSRVSPAAGTRLTPREVRAAGRQEGRRQERVIRYYP